MLRLVYLLPMWLVANIAVTAQDAQPRPRQLDSLSGGDVLRRYSEDTKSTPLVDFSGGDVIRSLLNARVLDKIGGGQILMLLDPLTGGEVLRSLDKLSNGQFLSSLDNFKGGEVFRTLNHITGGDLLRSLDAIEGMDVLLALDKARKDNLRFKDNEPKRTLDTLNGMAFGASKRFDSLSGAAFGLSKRNFDEIDNVGFNRFAKKSLGGSRGKSRGHVMLSLAKRSSEANDHTDFGALVKKNFDEIDRTGFEEFTKRESKDSP